MLHIYAYSLQHYTGCSVIVRSHPCSRDTYLVVTGGDDDGELVGVAHAVRINVVEVEAVREAGADVGGRLAVVFDGSDGGLQFAKPAVVLEESEVVRGLRAVLDHREVRVALQDVEPINELAEELLDLLVHALVKCAVDDEENIGSREHVDFSCKHKK